jgi:hypothetical protein
MKNIKGFKKLMHRMSRVAEPGVRKGVGLQQVGKFIVYVRNWYSVGICKKGRHKNADKKGKKIHYRIFSNIREKFEWHGIFLRIDLMFF